jgi:hypothetical protein
VLCEGRNQELTSVQVSMPAILLLEALHSDEPNNRGLHAKWNFPEVISASGAQVTLQYEIVGRVFYDPTISHYIARFSTKIGGSMSSFFIGNSSNPCAYVAR